MSGRSTALVLYRAILSSHRRKLPAEHRKLGDAYVKEEFRAHKDAAPGFVKTFMDEWSTYLVTLQQQEGNFGAHMSTTQIGDLNEEQATQLRELRAAAMQRK
jgi:hypothetical protein